MRKKHGNNIDGWIEIRIFFRFFLVFINPKEKETKKTYFYFYVVNKMFSKMTFQARNGKRSGGLKKKCHFEIKAYIYK